MRKLRKCAIVILCAALLTMSLAAAEGLSASVEGSTLRVNWSVNCGGVAVLTVYRDNWPICVFNVNCADGGASVHLGTPSGKYSVRLKTDAGCLTAAASSPKTAAPEPTPSITEAPIPAPTEVPTLEPTQAPTPEPTQVPTPEPTPVPTPTPTATPTPKPTATPAPTANSGSNRTGLASQVVEQVNAERAKAGLSTLRVDSELTRAACVRAQEIVRQFSHTRPDGTSWSTVSSAAHGENIAKGHNNANAVMAAWMSSQGHRENILRASYDTIGVCAYSYNGIIYWVQLFG